MNCFCFPTRKPGTNLIYIKRCAQTLHTPVQVYHNLHTAYLEACAQGAVLQYSMFVLLNFRLFEVVVRTGIERQQCLSDCAFAQTTLQKYKEKSEPPNDSPFILLFYSVA